MNNLEIFVIIILCVFSYLLSSINFAIIIGHIYLKDDIRNYGSKNAGMSNVLRSIGKKAAFFTCLGDTLKGFIPIFITKIIFNTHFDSSNIDLIFICYIVGFCALLGHIFPVFYNFKGGKGILTAAGVMISIDFLTFFILLIIFLILSFSTKIISIGSIGISILLPFISFFVQKLQNRFTLMSFYCTIIMGFILLLMHYSNIKRLIKGSENKFDKKSGK